MGKGLSPLQKQILEILASPRTTNADGHRIGKASRREIMERLYGWPKRDGAAVDKKEYQSAHASVSRAIKRLWQRGLIYQKSEKVAVRWASNPPRVYESRWIGDKASDWASCVYLRDD